MMFFFVLSLSPFLSHTDTLISPLSWSMKMFRIVLGFSLLLHCRLLYLKLEYGTFMHMHTILMSESLPSFFFLISLPSNKKNDANRFLSLTVSTRLITQISSHAGLRHGFRLAFSWYLSHDDY